MKRNKIFIPLFIVLLSGLLCTGCSDEFGIKRITSFIYFILPNNINYVIYKNNEQKTLFERTNLSIDHKSFDNSKNTVFRDEYDKNRDAFYFYLDAFNCDLKTRRDFSKKFEYIIQYEDGAEELLVFDIEVPYLEGGDWIITDISSKLNKLGAIYGVFEYNFDRSF